MKCSVSTSPPMCYRKCSTGEGCHWMQMTARQPMSIKHIYTRPSPVYEWQFTLARKITVIIMHILVLKTWHFRLWFCEWYIYYQACLFTCTSYGSTFRSSCVPLQSWMDGVCIIWILSPLQNTNSLTNMF